jgi:glycerol-3-phosphate acyltransferase PlsY
MDRGLACFLLGIFISYLLGSIPTAYILGRILKRIDIRKFGSGNVGTTNAFRILGKRSGTAVLIIDILKGFIPAVFIGDYIILRHSLLPAHLVRITLGLAAVIGHSWTIFLNFKGGKGVATTFGVMAGLALKIAGFKFVLMSSILIWLITLFFFRMVSLASVLTALFFPLFMFLFNQSKELIVNGLFFSLFIILRHLPNIQRILKREEPHLK